MFMGTWFEPGSKWQIIRTGFEGGPEILTDPVRTWFEPGANPVLNFTNLCEPGSKICEPGSKVRFNPYCSHLYLTWSNWLIAMFWNSCPHLSLHVEVRLLHIGQSLPLGALMTHWLEALSSFWVRKTSVIGILEARGMSENDAGTCYFQ